MITNRILTLACVLLLACQPKPKGESTVEARPTPPPEVESDTSPTPATDSALRGVVAKPAALDSARPTEATPISVPKRTEVPTLTVAELVATAAYVGGRVRVTGRCLGYGVQAATGGPPLTRSDWLLEDRGETIYVSGALPEGCSATQGSETPTTILVEVAQDTLRPFGKQAPTPRRYLIRTVP